MNMVTVKAFNKNHVWVYSKDYKSNWDLDWNSLGELDIYQKGGPSTLQNDVSFRRAKKILLKRFGVKVIKGKAISL